ncbi:MAG: MFS transporter [Bacteriovoracia bacterium]
MATLDASIVNVALPSITTLFRTGLAHSRWIIIAYLFSITGFLLFFGRVADMLSRKLIFNLGYFVFSLGSLFCALASSMSELIAFRAFQGFGAAMLMSNGPAIITAAFPSNKRGAALGILSMAVSIGLAIGPTLGGLLVNFFSWKSIFLVNIPFGVLGAVLVYNFVPFDHGMPMMYSERELSERARRLPLSAKIQLSLEQMKNFDWVGTLLWALFQFAFVFAIDRENILGFSGPAQRIMSFAAAGILLLFFIWEASAKEPILNLTLFRSRMFLTSNLSNLFSSFLVSSITLLMPFYFQNVRLMEPHHIGLLMTAIPASTFCVAPFSGRLADRFGNRGSWFLSILGITCMVTALALLSLDHISFGLQAKNPNKLLIVLILMGVGLGVFQSPNSNSIMGAVSREHLGVASALLATIRNFGLVLGTAVSSGFLMHYYYKNALVNPDLMPADNFITALRDTFFILAMIGTGGIITSLAKGGAREGRVK